MLLSVVSDDYFGDWSPTPRLRGSFSFVFGSDGKLMRLSALKRWMGDALFRFRAASGAYHVSRLLPVGSAVTAVLMYHGLETDPWKPIPGDHGLETMA